MIDAVTLDRLRTFLAAVDEGSLSAACKLGRAQSVVSQTLANLWPTADSRLIRLKRAPIAT